MYSLEFAVDSTLRISVAFIFLTFLTSALRFTLRAQSKKFAFAADDYWLVASLVTFYSDTGMLLWGVYLA